MASQAKNVYQFKGSKPMGEGNGFVLMYQSIDTQPWSSDPFCMLIAPFLIRKAAYSPHERQYGKHTIQLQIGQYVTTLLNLAKSSALYGFYGKSKNPDEAAKSAVKRVLKILSEDGFLEFKTIGKGKDQCTVITLKNWANYQAKNVSVLKPIREPLEKPIETQSEQGLEANQKPNTEPKPSPNTNKGSKQQSKNHAESKSQLCEIKTLQERGFEHFWKHWRNGKVAIGKVPGPKQATFDDKFKKHYPLNVIQKNPQKFKDDINAMCQFIVEVFDDIGRNGNEAGYRNHANMYPAKFLSNKQWRDEE